MNKPDFDLVQYQKNVISDMQEKLYCQVEENDRLLGIISSQGEQIDSLKEKLKKAVLDMNGIGYLCGNGKPYLLGNATLRICDHYPGAASNKRPSCQYFTWKGMEE